MARTHYQTSVSDGMEDRTALHARIYNEVQTVVSVYTSVQKLWIMNVLPTTLVSISDVGTINPGARLSRRALLHLMDYWRLVSVIYRENVMT